MSRCKNRCVVWDIFITQSVDVRNCFSRVVYRERQLLYSNPSSSIRCLCLMLAKVSISRWRRCCSTQPYMCNYHPKYTNTKWENGIKLSTTAGDCSFNWTLHRSIIDNNNAKGVGCRYLHEYYENYYDCRKYWQNDDCQPNWSCEVRFRAGPVLHDSSLAARFEWTHKHRIEARREGAHFSALFSSQLSSCCVWILLLALAQWLTRTVRLSLLS